MTTLKPNHFTNALFDAACKQKVSKGIHTGPLKLSSFPAKIKEVFTCTPTKSTLAMGVVKQFPIFKQESDGVLVPYFLGKTFCQTIDRVPMPFIRPTAITCRAKLREGQEEAIKSMHTSLLHSYGVFLNAPPGTGKTVMAIGLIATLKQAPICICVDMIDLVEQWVARILEHSDCKSIGLLCSTADKNRIQQMHNITLVPIEEADITIISIQSLIAHPRPIQCALLIVDEAHAFSAPTFSQAIFNFTFKYSLALTASLIRADALEWVFRAFLGSNTIAATSTKMYADIYFHEIDAHLPDWDFLFEFRYCYIKRTRVILDTCKNCSCYGMPKYGKFVNLVDEENRVHGTFWECFHIAEESTFSGKYNYTAMKKKLLCFSKYQICATHILEQLIADGRNLIVFVEFLDVIDGLLAVLLQKGYDAGAYTGRDTTKKGKEQNEEAKYKQITLTTFKKAGKGLDLPDKDGILFISGPSKHQLNQFIGRIERTAHNKKTPIVVHLVDTSNALFKATSYGWRKTYNEMKRGDYSSYRVHKFPLIERSL